MRYRHVIDEDHVNHLIGRCMRNKEDAKRMYDILISQNRRCIDLITGTVHLSPNEHEEFVNRFSSEIEPTLWDSARRKH